MMVLPELTNESFRKGMENGWCFAVSHYSNGVELNGMEEIPGFDGEKLMKTEAYLRDDTPLVTRITVDDENDTISIEGENFNSITWVSNCNVIRRETGISDGKATLDLRADDLLDTPYLYVRFYITGDNGICYSQPLRDKQRRRGLRKSQSPENSRYFYFTAHHGHGARPDLLQVQPHYLGVQTLLPRLQCL